MVARVESPIHQKYPSCIKEVGNFCGRVVTVIRETFNKVVAAIANFVVGIFSYFEKKPKETVQKIQNVEVKQEAPKEEPKKVEEIQLKRSSWCSIM